MDTLGPASSRSLYVAAGPASRDNQTLPSQDAVRYASTAAPDRTHFAPRLSPTSPSTPHGIPFLSPAARAPIPRGLKLVALKIQVRLGPHLYKNYGWGVFRAGPKTLVKRINTETRFNEALTMYFITRNTTIPIPRVLYIFIVNKKLHLVM